MDTMGSLSVGQKTDRREMDAFPESFAGAVQDRIDKITTRVRLLNEGLSQTADRAFGEQPVTASANGPRPQEVRTGNFGRVIDLLETLEIHVGYLEGSAARFGCVA